MATTRECFEDGVRWVIELVRVGARRAVVLGLLVALFAAAVVISTRETVSDCGDVTDDQRARLASLIEAEAGRSFVTVGPARCVDGEYAAQVVGLAETMDRATDQLIAQGWVLETTYIGYYRQSWRRCFRRDAENWERVQIIVDATRGGAVRAVTASAPEGVDACDLERRDASEIYPPSD